MPGSGPFDLTLNESVAYFPTLFLLYAAFHELGHLTQRHSTDQRKLEEEVSCDFFALFAVRHLFNLAGFRVPFEVGAAAMFYGVLEHVSMVDKMQKIDRNERPDAQFYNLSPDNFVDTRPLDQIWESSILTARSSGVARLIQEIERPEVFSIGCINPVRTFWHLIAEMKVLVGASLQLLLVLEKPAPVIAPVIVKEGSMSNVWRNRCRKPFDRLWPWIEDRVHRTQHQPGEEGDTGQTDHSIVRSDRSSAVHRVFHCIVGSTRMKLAALWTELLKPLHKS